jgi:hypothetical protein
VTALSVSAVTEQAQVLTAATYGRGVWQTPLWTAVESLTTAAASPVGLTFASQPFGTAGSPQTVTLTNTGSLPLMPTAIAMSGDFSETDGCQGATVAVSGSCTIQVTFTPSATGSRTGQMTISANVYGGQVTVALGGTGTAAGAVTLTPPTVDFGQVEVGATSAPLQVEAGNSGTASVPISSLTVTGPFAIASNACGTSALAANADCQITVNFAPTQAGAAAGTLILTDGAGTQTVNLTGTGVAPPTDILNPASVQFPATAVGQISAAQPVLVTNTGDLPLTSITASVTGVFQIAGNTCGTQLAGHSVCTFNVVFAPAQLGAQTGVLSVGDALKTQTVPLAGTGVQAAALSVNLASLNFPEQAVGVASAPQILTIMNAGGVPAANIGFQFTGQAAASFAVGTTTCAASLAGGGSCTVQVIFTPSAAGGSTATLVISSSTAGVQAVSVPLNGAGQAASGLNVSPSALAFPATVVGLSSAAQTVTVSNTSSVAASQLTLAATPGFTLAANTCTATLAAAANCTVGVVFTPAATGPATGALTVSSASISAPARVTLTATGSAASAIAVTPASIAFPETGVGLMSAATTVTVTNSGTVTALSNLALTVPAGFVLENNTCPASLGPGASCTAGIEFAPAVAGAQTGALTVSSSTVAAPVTVPLSGMGFDFTVTIAGSGTQSVAAGQTANYTLVVTPLNGSAGTFTLGCDALPTNALCIFNPATETLSAGATGNVGVGVSTGNSSAAISARPLGWRAAPLVCAVLLLPFAWVRRRRLLQMALMLTIVVSAVTSCTGSGGGSGSGGGGSGGGTGGSSTTPVGTYSIPVSVTSTGLTHSVTVTLTVD